MTLIQDPGAGSAALSSAGETPAPAVRLVRGPRPGWLGGNLADFNRDPLDFLSRCARDYGSFVQLKFGGFPIYFLNEPALIEEVLVTQNRKFQKGRGLARTRDLLGNGLLTSEGEFWRRQRRLAQPAFHSQRIAAYGEIMQRWTERMLAGWRDGQALDAHAAMMDLTMAIVAEALFSADVTGEAQVVSRAMDNLLKDFTNRNRMFWLPAWVKTPSKVRAERATRTLDEVVYAMIRERRAHPEEQRADLLGMLLAARDEGGQGMTDRQLRDEVMTLFLAGHETTADTLSWTWMLLHQNPQAEARLHEELTRVLAGRTPTTADLPALPYTAHVVQEAMRLYPPAWVIGRQAEEPVTIGGVEIAPGAGIIMSQWVMHRDARYYPDPDVFRPERWEGDFARRIPEFAYFPFGGGPRLCIGRPFALQEGALVLAMVAQRFRLELVPGRTIKPQPSITLRPIGGVPVVVRGK
jgi:cytochrome P450